MVYRGKPSAACERCRGRRLKCDQGNPSCTQCIRAKVECPGYRDPLDSCFRDQSQEVIRKSQSQRQTHNKRIVTTHSERVTPLTHSSPDVPSPTAAPHYPAQELAKGYLFCNYMSGGPRADHMSYLVPLIEDSQNLAVNSALNAVGLAALSNIRMSPQMMLKARREYTAALSHTNQALQDPIKSKQDDILAAVVLLGMFEVMTCTDDSFIDRWMKHMDGAAQLIDHRGLEQLNRPEGLRLFTQLRSQITTSRIYQERYISTSLVELTEDAKQHRQSNDVIMDNFGLIVIRLANFCAALKDGSIADSSEIIRAALTMDAELTALFMDVPSQWHYTTKKVPMAEGKSVSELFWGEYYHIYQNFTSSSVWNNYRSCRILLHELIIDTVKTTNSASTDETSHRQRQILIEQSRQIARQLVEEICASAPFHFSLGIEEVHGLDDSGSGHMSQSDISGPGSACRPAASETSSFRISENGSFSGKALHSDCESPQFSPKTGSSSTYDTWRFMSSSPFEVTGAGGLTLMWPLLIAANSGLASNDLRQWITVCLEKIGYSMGINQALAMAQLLRKGMRTRAWLTPDFTSPEAEESSSNSVFS
ncbi:hypothetical protein F1880_007677 [Penicillium rolfsii]|nr:hypothetical protein F1880_007677 [Penicillium rolfsii]